MKAENAIGVKQNRPVVETPVHKNITVIIVTPYPTLYQKLRLP